MRAKPDRIIRKVEGYLREQRMLSEGQKVLAGVSGGSDSIVMLHLLRELQPVLGYELRVVHVNHGIRGAEAARDAAYVQEVCKEWNIPCTVVEKSVPELAGLWKTGEEEAGRRVRREAFREEAERLGLRENQVRIALAHNQEDRAETMLHNLSRGTGLIGLASMRPVTGSIIRPILCLTKQEILTYAERYSLAYVTDSTNDSDAYTRNRIRHHVLPELARGVNPQAAANLCRTSELAAQAVDYLEQQAQSLLDRCERSEGQLLFGESFWQQPDVLQSFAVYQGLKTLGGREQDLTQEHVQMVRELYGRQVGRRVILPYGLQAVRVYEGILLKKESPESKCVEELPEKVLPIPGVLTLGEHRLEVCLLPYSGQKIVRNQYTKWFDYAKIKDTLTVRSRRTGDQMVITADGNHKPVRRVMIDARVPSEVREKLPLVAMGNEILWIPGVRSGESCRITESTCEILEIRYQGGEQDE